MIFIESHIKKLQSNKTGRPKVKLKDKNDILNRENLLWIESAVQMSEKAITKITLISSADRSANWAGHFGNESENNQVVKTIICLMAKKTHF